MKRIENGSRSPKSRKSRGSKLREPAARNASDTYEEDKSLQNNILKVKSRFQQDDEEGDEEESEEDSPILDPRSIEAVKRAYAKKMKVRSVSKIQIQLLLDFQFKIFIYFKLL